MGVIVYMHNASNILEQIKSLKNGNGIQYLINAASEILENPILMHDVDYQLVSYTEKIVTDDPLWNELMSTGEHGGESLKLFRDEGFMDTVANTKTVALLTSPKIKYDRIFGKVFNKNGIMVACIDLICYNRPFASGDLEAFDAFREVLSKELSKSRYYQTYGKMYQESLIRKLIDGSIADKTFYSCHVANIYQGLKTNLFLAVADISQSGSDYTALASLLDSFVKVKPDLKYAIYSNYIVIILSSDAPRLNVKEEIPGLSKIFRQHNIYVGISDSFENLYQLPTYYAQALESLNFGLKSDNRQRAFSYDEIGSGFAKKKINLG